MRKRINEMTVTELKGRKKSLEQTIQICNDYLASCPNTFLGPLGAKAEIKRCQKELDMINTRLLGY